VVEDTGAEPELYLIRIVRFHRNTESGNN
jgi:hypothetical protein